MGIELEPPQRAELESQLLGEVLARLESGDAPPAGVTNLVSSPLTERDVGHGIESAYRTLAATRQGGERIVFVDRANSVVLGVGYERREPVHMVRSCRLGR